MTTEEKTTTHVVYDSRSRFFSNVSGENLMVLQLRQNYFNDKLRAKGYLFLNEVLEMLDIPTIREGQFAGWVWKKYQSFPTVDLGLPGEEIGIAPIELELNCMADIHDLVWGDKK
jgi:hypothetical protein